MVYFVATPIGNLKEMTYRAVEVLNAVDVILCEDTRHTLILLKEYGISKPLYSYHKFNEKSMLPMVEKLLNEDKNIALVSDAGMPCINDPGNILVNRLIELNKPYTVVSGANACINAFVLSGYQPPFTYAGFLPDKNKDRKLLMAQLPLESVLIFYVSVHDLEEVRNYLLQQLGDRRCCLVKEISKLHEQVLHTTLSTPFEDSRGEFVLVVDRADSKQQPTDSRDAQKLVQQLIESGMSKNDAIKTVAKQLNVNKNEIYKLFVNDNKDK